MVEEYFKIKSIDKTFHVLEKLKINKLGISELSKLLGIPKSTIFNILYTLKKLGYVKQDNENQKFELSPKWFGLCQAIEFDVRNIAKPYLIKLTQKTHENSNLVLRQGTKIFYIEKVESSEPININTQIGMEDDIYCTAVGKVILAFLDKNIQDKIYKSIDFKPKTPNTITSLNKLKEEINETKKKGFAIDNEESTKNVKCIAAPVFNYKGEPKNAISVTGVVERINKQEENISSLIIKYANEISRSLGYNGQL